jgi:hypothetical protein
VALAAAATAAIAVLWDLYNWISGGESVLRELWRTWTAFVDDFTQNEDKDFWLTTLIKSVFLTISDLPGAWRDAVDDIKRYFSQFFDWLDQKISKYNIFGKFGDWLGDKLANDGTDGMINTRRGFAYGGGSPFGGGSSPEASAAGARAKMASWAGSFAPQVNVHVNGATDPKAVAAEVEAQVDNHWSRMIREFVAVTGS